MKPVTERIVDGSSSDDGGLTSQSGGLPGGIHGPSPLREVQVLRPLSSDGQEAAPDQNDNQREEERGQQKGPNKPVAWKDLPRKDQLVVITLARLSEPLVQTSLQAYLFYQLKWFDNSLPDSTISSQAGALHACFMGAQFLTAMLWGRIGDSRRFGRKSVLLIGLLGTSLSSLGFGFSTTFWQALFFRTLGGATNGNIGVMRTMISEIIREKKFQARAFILLPMTFNIGIILGPILGGLLSDPAGSYPDLFGDVAFFKSFPYATPNIVSALFLLGAAAAVWLFLEETHDALRDGPPDFGRRIGQKLSSILRGRRSEYSTVPTSDADPDLDEASGVATTPVKQGKRYTQTLPFKRIFTRNVSVTLFAYFLMTAHVGTFNSLWFVFLSTPTWDPATSEHPARHLPFRFTGGLGLQPQSVGFAMAILGVVGITMQLLIYPALSARLGTLRSWRYFLPCFPLVYFLVPYLSVVPSTTEPPAPKTGPAVWAALVAVLAIHVLGRTFALPSATILINNCTPHPSVLGTIHGLGQSVSSGARTVGPVIGGVVYGLGLNAGVVGLMWWILSGLAICGFVASQFVKEGDGHEIWLEGDEDF